MRKTRSHNSAQNFLLPLLAVWFFCASVGGLAHFACHLDDINAQNPQPAVPHPCLICQSLAQSPRSDIAAQVRAALMPHLTSFYVPLHSEIRVMPSAPLRLAVFNRGPPMLRS